ncbi:hypothetical protein E1A91_A05G236600v1 [Gossypium mustelinum]|uniref:Pentacotripeptide-repeat region of PRORP domain-containing protein n=1 Tax=Gossypium mustelinum TaxID=34275 RepID=A0A5D2Z9S0_GOSMU|nr:hypothetical protein E1A91_A05G236600v1 [Gossypium mustelinum]
MASRSIFSNLKSNGGNARWGRLLSSITSRVKKASVRSAAAASNESLKGRILGLRLPTESATEVLRSWVDSGQKVDIPQLLSITQILHKSGRYNHALEILTWQETQKGLQMSAVAHATKVKLLIKVGNLTAAEEHFNRLPNTASQKAACLPLLNGCVKERDIGKAEAFMSKLASMGMTLCPHLYNEMMKLYIATSQFEKVPLVIKEMNRNKIPKNVLSYNLWMDASARSSGVAKAEAVYAEMLSDERVCMGWSTLSTLANIYTKAGLVQKAETALKTAETKLSANNSFGYIFLMTQYALLKKKTEVLRLWQTSKLIGKRMTCANYMCILSCLVQLGGIVEAEKVFMEWEYNCRNYDIRVSNVLLGAYVKNGWMEKAESLHRHTLEKGGCPNYKTWEILMEGWVKSQNMVKAVTAMKKAFALLKYCHWRPPHYTLVTIAEYFEKHGNSDDANNFFRDVQRLGLASSEIYKSWLRNHLLAKRPVLDILEMMYKDGIEMDNEISALVQALNEQSKCDPEIRGNAFQMFLG